MHVSQTGGVYTMPRMAFQALVQDTKLGLSILP